MKECDLTIPVRKYLTERGYTCYYERFGHDIIGVKDGRYVIVELKLGFTQNLYTQCVRSAMWADEVYACIPDISLNKSGVMFYNFKHSGIGVMQVIKDKVRVRLHAKQQPWHWHKTRTYRVAQIANTLPSPEHHLAGLPCNNLMSNQRSELRLINEVCP